MGWEVTQMSERVSFPLVVHKEPTGATEEKISEIFQRSLAHVCLLPRITHLSVSISTFINGTPLHSLVLQPFQSESFSEEEWLGMPQAGSEVYAPRL